jgi:large subunit ribosomal protein L27e
VKPFIKMVNYTHLMPTRYLLEVELKSVVTTELMGTQTNPTARQNARKEVKKLLESKYNNSLQTGKNKWFFQKLRF